MVLVVAIVAAFDGVGCRPSLEALCVQSAPPWAGGTPDRGGGVFVGTACDVPRSSAIHAAASEALSAFTSELGVRVRSRVVRVEAANDRGTSENVRAIMDVRGMPVTVRGAMMVRSHVFGDGDNVDAWVAVRVPAAERGRLERLAVGKTAVTIECSTSGQPGCPPGLVDRVIQAASAAGLNLAGATRVVTFADARAAGAAYWLRVTVDARFHARIDDEYFAYADARLDWFDTADEKSLVSAAALRVKGGQLSRSTALVAALLAAAGRLAARINAGTIHFAHPSGTTTGALAR